MKLQIPNAVIEKVKSQAKSDALRELGTSSWSDSQSVDSNLLEPSELTLILDACNGSTEKGIRGLTSRLRSLINISEGKAKKYVNLELLTEVVRDYVKKLPNAWLFAEAKQTGELNPELITNVEYSPPDNRRDYYKPAQLSIRTVAMQRGERMTDSYRATRETLSDGVDAPGLFSSLGLLPETPELVDAYRKSMDKYAELRQKVGWQLVALGKAEVLSGDEDDRWWRKVKTVDMDKEGLSGRVVVDDEEGRKDESPVYAVNSNLHGGDEFEKELDEGGELKQRVVRIPEHPYVRVFDLRNYVYCLAHVDKVDDYFYDRAAFGKVVLAAEIKEMIDALVALGAVGDDIVGGKGKGIVILCSGFPGVGKTLCSETYAEHARRPLYSVQCSQLGLNPEQVEGNLATFLDRCTRWGAIGLLDEADVFIRERGDDLNQNAIVGVFLRVLEYYRGVLFLTTNRRGLIDDAVLSRCIAHVRFDLPTEQERKRIWRIMFNQFDLSGDDTLLNVLASGPKISGRTIKQLCRLAKVIVDRTKQPLTEEVFAKVVKFQDMGDE